MSEKELEKRGLSFFKLLVIFFWRKILFTRPHIFDFNVYFSKYVTSFVRFIFVRNETPYSSPGSLCVTRDITRVNYREHVRRSLGLKNCKKMETKIDETYHVASSCGP